MEPGLGPYDGDTEEVQRRGRGIRNHVVSSWTAMFYQTIKEYSSGITTGAAVVHCGVMWIASSSQKQVGVTGTVRVPTGVLTKHSLSEEEHGE